MGVSEKTLGKIFSEKEFCENQAKFSGIVEVDDSQENAVGDRLGKSLFLGF